LAPYTQENTQKEGKKEGQVGGRQLEEYRVVSEVILQQREY